MLATYCWASGTEDLPDQKGKESKIFWALESGQCPKETVLAGARNNRSNQMQLKGKTGS